MPTVLFVCSSKEQTQQAPEVSEAAGDIQIINILSCDWMSIGSLHFLVFVKKVTSYLSAKLFGHMTTSNSLAMLSDIMVEHGRPEMVVSDSGPPFRN